jgi:hypothetical protein
MIRGMVFISPGRCCWSCERVLPLMPKAILTTSPAPTLTNGWVLNFVCDRPDCAQEVVHQMQSLGLGVRLVDYLEALALIHGVDELEITEGWERSTLNRARDIKLAGSIRALTETLGADRPWFVSRTGASARLRLASLGMGTRHFGGEQ